MFCAPAADQRLRPAVANWRPKRRRRRSLACAMRPCRICLIECAGVIAADRHRQQVVFVEHAAVGREDVPGGVAGEEDGVPLGESPAAAG